MNHNKPERWKADIALSVDLYNDWFMEFAPKTFRSARSLMTQSVNNAIKVFDDLQQLTPNILRQYPASLATLRMATAPPLARDRLIGFAKVSRGLIQRMELNEKLPERMENENLSASLDRIIEVIKKLLDRDLFPWLDKGAPPTDEERERAASIVADRLTGASADPIVRNAQEKRQLSVIETFLKTLGYKPAEIKPGLHISRLSPGTYTFRYNVIAGSTNVNIPIDVIIQPKKLRPDKLPILIEAKSAGDFANTNKRRKEEATKMRQLKETYGGNVPFVLFLNGYFDSGYLGYEAAEGIDWVWEHRIEDLLELGI